jgi:hypothetical protein
VYTEHCTCLIRILKILPHNKKSKYCEHIFGTESCHIRHTTNNNKHAKQNVPSRHVSNINSVAQGTKHAASTDFEM